MALPQDFKDKYTALLGENEAQLFFESLETQHEQKAFRTNRLKPTVPLENWFFDDLQPAPYSKDGWLHAVSGKSPLHQAGYVYSQEPSAMIVASIADVKPGEYVLDLCAAPGGKSTQLANDLQQDGILVANEIVPKRAKILSENIERWGAQNVFVTSHAPHELVQHFTGFFDTIVVDAPCSGEGMFRKDAQAIEEWTSQTPLDCAMRQKEILTSAITLLKHNGTLVYSTCTFAPEENEEIISWLVENFPVSIVPIQMPQTHTGKNEWGSVPDLDKTIRLWPHLDQGEGHFVAKLQFHGHNTKTTPKNQRATSLSKEQSESFSEFINHFPFAYTGTLHVFKDQLWAVPDGIPLNGLKLLRNGLHLGTFLKKRFEPSFALAMAASTQVDHLPTLTITEDEWRKYVAGETFQKDGNSGWVLLVHQQLVVGFGKHVQGTVKNFYPKGLRFNP